MRWLVVVAIAFAARVDAQTDAGWELVIPERLELPAGTTGTLPISIAIDRHQTISKDAALILDLAPEPGVSVKRRRLGRADAVDPDDETPRFTIPVGTQRTGDFTIKVHLRFWLCGTKVCRPIDARRTVTVSVSTPTPAPVPTDAGVDASPPDASRKRGK